MCHQGNLKAQFQDSGVTEMESGAPYRRDWQRSAREDGPWAATRTVPTVAGAVLCPAPAVPPFTAGTPLPAASPFAKESLPPQGVPVAFRRP